MLVSGRVIDFRSETETHIFESAGWSVPLAGPRQVSWFSSHIFPMNTTITWGHQTIDVWNLKSSKSKIMQWTSIYLFLWWNKNHRICEFFSPHPNHHPKSSSKVISSSNNPATFYPASWTAQAMRKKTVDLKNFQPRKHRRRIFGGVPFWSHPTNVKKKNAKLWALLKPPKKLDSRYMQLQHLPVRGSKLNPRMIGIIWHPNWKVKVCLLWCFLYSLINE